MFRHKPGSIVESEAGYSIETLGQNGLVYMENGRRLHLFSEFLVGKPDIAVAMERALFWEDSGKRVTPKERERVAARITAALKFAGLDPDLYEPPDPPRYDRVSEDVISCDLGFAVHLRLPSGLLYLEEGNELYAKTSVDEHTQTVELDKNSLSQWRSGVKTIITAAERDRIAMNIVGALQFQGLDAVAVTDVRTLRRKK